MQRNRKPLTDEQGVRRREACARYRAKHKGKRLAANTAWYKANPHKAREYAKRYYQKNTAKALAAMKRNKYRMSPEVYDALMATAVEGCKVCGDPFSGTRRPHIDHCHSSGRVRGLLCDDCNKGLGRFQDSPERLAGAIRYLQIFKAIEAAESLNHAD